MPDWAGDCTRPDSCASLDEPVEVPKDACPEQTPPPEPTCTGDDCGGGGGDCNVPDTCLGQSTASLSSSSACTRCGYTNCSCEWEPICNDPVMLKAIESCDIFNVASTCGKAYPAQYAKVKALWACMDVHCTTVCD